MERFNMEMLRPTRAALFAAAAIGLSCAWWNLLHEVAFFYMETYDAQALNCFFGFLAGSAVAGAIYVLRTKGRLDALRPTMRMILLGCDVALVLLYYYLVDIAKLYELATACYVLINMSFYALLIYALQSLKDLTMHEVVLALAGAAVVYSLVELVLQPLFFRCNTNTGLTAIFFVRMAIHIVLLLASSVMLARLAAGQVVPASAPAPVPAPASATASVDAASRQPQGDRVFRAPVQLIIHVLFYSVVFGAIHNLASGIVDVPSMKLTPNHFGMLLGAILFLASFGFQVSSGRIWVKARAVAFPVAMAGFIVLPLSMEGAASFSVAVGDCATICYYLIFLLACVSISRRIDADVLQIASFAVLVATLGFVIGDAGSSTLRTLNVLGTTTYVLLTLLAFIMLIIATFWIGDDRRAALLWGLEEKRAPQKFDLGLINERCDAVTALYDLSARESEVLRLLAQEKKPDQIKDELFISIATVRSHIHRIYVKLKVHSNVQLMELIQQVPISSRQDWFVSDDAAVPGAASASASASAGASSGSGTFSESSPDTASTK